MQYQLYSHNTSLTKRLLKWLPEVYFIVFNLWWAIGTYLGQKSLDNSVLINYPALILIAAFVVQFFIKNKHLGISLSAILILGTAFLSLTLFSDVLRFSSFDNRVIKFIIYGILLISLNLFMAIRMFRKYQKVSDNKDTNDYPLGI